MRRPGDFFFQSNLRRWAYKKVVAAIDWRRAAAGRQLMSSLPLPAVEIGPQGYLILKPNQQLNSLQSQAIEAASRIVETRSDQQGWHNEYEKGSEFIRNLLFGNTDLEENSEILQFGLSEEVLAVVCRYMGQLPVMPWIFLWRSVPRERPYVKSQLWHLDHSDTCQVRMIIFPQKITAADGPIILLPAPISQRVRRELSYSWHNEANMRISDVRMAAHADSDEAVTLTGEKGTVVFVDTSRCFHYGSRLEDGSRHILLYRYMTTSNFLLHPLRESYPLSSLAKLSGLLPIQRAVLTGDSISCAEQTAS